jgi:tetratricopeptide (TPR) repeat protein
MNKGPIPVEIPKQARKYFQTAIALDAGFAEAYAFLSMSYVNLSQFSFTSMERKSILDSVKYFAGKAIELDPNNYLAHIAMANVYWPEYDIIRFSREINKAYEINPAEAKMYKVSILQLLDGEDDEALKLAKEAALSDPLNIEVLFGYGNVMFLEGRYDESIAVFNQVVALDSNQWGAFASLGWSYLYKNETKKGLKEWSKAMQLYGRPELAQLFLTSDFKTAMDAFFKWQTSENEGIVMNKYGGFANIYSYFRDRENTIKCLELAYKNNEALTDLKRWPGFDFIRKDPAFISLYEKAGFKAYDEYKKRQQ